MSQFARLGESCKQHPPDAFVVLGSGLGDVIEDLDVRASCPFAQIPELPVATVAGHRGEFSHVTWQGKNVLVSVGRLHYYEGHPWEVVVKPIQLAARLGCTVAILTNAAGGIREDLAAGTIMPLRDHLEWNRPNPWREPKQPSPYAKRLLDLLRADDVARPPGVYASVTGPSYETPAEIRSLRSQGADAVGMSTSREAVAGCAAGMEVLALSLITNRAAGLSGESLDHTEVMLIGKRTALQMRDLIESLLSRM